ncbi:MAPEG family protein [Polynucleobacter paneuropaeus]|uniref:MAPEG family protein n=1 Tax=Polynucleobacter paneuropaeus TaxID=2527775 RepID=A0A9Q2WKH9_9BURK|nr:MAPEG family protein [Polynucleobacter paneuropaeus]AWW47518.1 MAPEG family protein [Polynucleobacter paneuropaeus]MBT8537077.1 MAPEG family protein [Polynucleobacter paneuropaeus]MBT8544293.1 MAPEG family protein [Polynucleobacter paneuropaeus]MBT8552061.1 MAPEG family protein [Polynucleobacter paneuropaeus]MBT8634637.1 MAPEG family protein [Polynucleobacter paneuropaeus]
MQAYLYTAFITLLTVALLFAVTFNVGRARGKYQIKAPAVLGHEMFERAYRIQLNTIENVLMFLPALWLYAIFIGDKGAGDSGMIWLLGRIWYAIAYQNNPAKRGYGFLISLLVIAGLWLGAAYGIYGAYLKA